MEADEVRFLQPPPRGGDHVPAWLDRFDVQPQRNELLCELPRSGPNLHDPGFGVEACELDRSSDELARVARASRVVCLRDPVEHLAVPLRFENPLAHGGPVDEPCPVDLGFPTPAVLIRRDQRLDAVEQRQPVSVRKVGEPSHRGEERQQAVPVDGLRIRQLRDLQRLERRPGDRKLLVTEGEPRTSEVERVVVDVTRARPSLGQELLESGDRRVRRPGREVPQEDERPARPEDADDLAERAHLVEPVEGLRREDGIDRGVGERMSSAVPVTVSASGHCVASRRRIDSAGSRATTRSNAATRSRVSFPVPAPSSSTVAVGGKAATSTASRGQPGRPRS